MSDTIPNCGRNVFVESLYHNALSSAKLLREMDWQRFFDLMAELNKEEE